MAHGSRIEFAAQMLGDDEDLAHGMRLCWGPAMRTCCADCGMVCMDARARHRRLCKIITLSHTAVEPRRTDTWMTL